MAANIAVRASTGKGENRYCPDGMAADVPADATRGPMTELSHAPTRSQELPYSHLAAGTSV